MMRNDGMSLVHWGDFQTAIALLTRLPVPAEFTRSAGASWAYPFAGWLVAALAGVVVTIALWLGIAAPLAAGLWLIATVVMTGAMHEDGLADCADGFWGGWDPARRLEIMKDSQIGTYGVLGLVMMMGLRWGAVWLLIEDGRWFWAMLAVEGLSRAVMPLVMHALPHARDTGLSHAQGQPSLPTALLALVVGGFGALLLVGWIALLLWAVAGLACAGMIVLAKQKIAGQTGDVLGATQQVAAVAMLLVLA